LDVTKLTVGTAQTGWLGYEVARLLNREFGIQIEYADTHGFLAIISLGNTKHDVDHLVSALQWIVRKKGRRPLVTPFGDVPALTTEMVMTPREAAFAKAEVVPFEQSVGRVCAEIVCPYPPGIPLLVPGERVSRETCQYLMELVKLGTRINGQDDAQLHFIKVVQDGGY